MMRRAVAACFATFAAVPLTIAGQDTADVPFPSEMVRSLTEAESADARQSATRQLFRKAAPAELRELVGHDDDQIALAAAWELIRQTLSKKPRVDRHGNEIGRPLGTVQVARFLGVLEGRLRVQPPQWWEKRLLEAESFGEDALGYPDETLRVPYEAVANDDLVNRDLFLLSGQRLSAKGDGMFFESAESDIRLPAAITAQLEEAQAETVVTGAVDEDRLFLTAHSRLPGGYPLHAVALESGDLQWTSSVWGGYMSIRGYSGSGHVHWTWILEKDGKVYVFGDAGHWLYLEGFRASDGKPVLRWATSY